MLGTLIAGIASGEMFAALRRLRGAIVVYALVALFAFVGVGFLVGAGFYAAASRWGAIEAALGFGIGFLLLAIVIAVVHALTRRSRARRVARQRGADIATLAGAAGIALLPVLLRSKPGALGLLAPLVAALGYGVYRENAAPRKRGDDAP